MDQVLFWIPIHTGWTPQGVPVYGFGVMLFLAFVIGSYVAGWRARLASVPENKLHDLILWLFILGLIGGRLLFLWQFDRPITEFHEIWNGGIVFYGGAIGGAIGAVIAHRRLLKPLGISAWTVADALAPAVMVGLCLGRVGCFMNGCCYGHVAAPGCPAACFPSLTSPARDNLVRANAEQTLVGFSMDDRAGDDRTVGRVEAGSLAEASGLQSGDVITAANGTPIKDYLALDTLLAHEWPRGQKSIALTVKRGGNEIALPEFTPRLIGLYPTQVYESISALLLFLALVATWPLRKYDGQLIVLLMLGYAVHRFVNESLRDDTPTYGLFTLSQWVSIGIFISGLLLGLIRRWQIGGSPQRKQG